MTTTKPRMHQGAFFFGVDASASRTASTLKDWARQAESAKFDAIFLADNVGMSDTPATPCASTGAWRGPPTGTPILASPLTR